MSKLGKIFGVGILAVFLCVTCVSAQTIADKYIGGDTPDGYWDVISSYSDQDKFDVLNVEVTEDSDLMYFDIYTGYVDNVGLYNTQLGDLFLSTDGWNPAGDKPYWEDHFGTGESWEYVFVLDDHLSETGGTWNLYAVNEANIQLSYAFRDDGSEALHRKQQEVQYNPTDKDELLASGDWFIDNTDDYLRYAIDLDLFDDVLALNGAGSYGFHWAMTCGNDVIEGELNPTPEPATMFLLGSGLLGLGAAGRRRKKA